MSNIEPTEEQKQAAEKAIGETILVLHWNSRKAAGDNLARLLAEREAKLRGDVEAAMNLTADGVRKCLNLRAEVARLEAKLSRPQPLGMVLLDENEALRARVAELEADLAAFMFGEAQHLADIKALTAALDDVLNDPNDIGEEDARDAGEALLARLAHYDDAKADAPAVDWQAWANGSCPEPGCSLANPHKQGAACVKPTDAEGGEE